MKLFLPRHFWETGHQKFRLSFTNYCILCNRCYLESEQLSLVVFQVNWNSTLDADGTQYTLVIFDSGYGFIHGLYLNIPGSDVSQGDVSTLLSLIKNFPSNHLHGQREIHS